MKRGVFHSEEVTRKMSVMDFWFMLVGAMLWFAGLPALFINENLAGALQSFAAAFMIGPVTLLLWEVRKIFLGGKNE